MKERVMMKNWIGWEHKILYRARAKINLMSFIDFIQRHPDYSDVALVRLNQKKIVIKFFVDHNHKSNEEINNCADCINFWMECKKMHKLRKVDNVIRLSEIRSNQQIKNVYSKYAIYPGFVMPYYRYTLTDIIMIQKLKFEGNQFKQLFKNLLITFNDIHSKSIIHADIKSDNIMFNDMKKVHVDYVVIDFGSSVNFDNIHEQKDNRLTTAGFISPEKIKGETFSEKIDVYAIAVMMILLAKRQYIFQQFKKETPTTKSLELSERRQYVYTLKGFGFKNNLFDLLKNMLEYDKKKRYNVSQCLNHSYFQKRMMKFKIHKGVLNSIKCT